MQQNNRPTQRTRVCDFCIHRRFFIEETAQWGFSFSHCGCVFQKKQKKNVIHFLWTLLDPQDQKPWEGSTQSVCKYRMYGTYHPHAGRVLLPGWLEQTRIQRRACRRADCTVAAKTEPITDLNRQKNYVHCAAILAIFSSAQAFNHTRHLRQRSADNAQYRKCSNNKAALYLSLNY